MKTAVMDSLSPSSPAKAADKKTLRIGIVLLDQFTLTAFAGFLDVLRLASDHGGQSRQILINWTVMSVDGLPRRSSAGTLHSELTDIESNGDFDYIAICGGNSYTSTHLSKRLSSWLVKNYETGVTLVGLCTGTFAIGHAGLLRQHTVCVHWNVLSEFERQFPDVLCRLDHLFIDSGRLITCAGSTAAIDLALYLLNRHFGQDKAHQALRHMMLFSIRPARLPQAHFYIDLENVADIRIHKAIHYIEQRIDDLPAVTEVADHVGVSARQLERLFKKSLNMSPAALQRMLRLQYGKWRLSNTRDSITSIALGCGFSDNSHFSREFKALFGMSPRVFRQTHMGEEGGVQKTAWKVPFPNHA